MEKRRGDEEAVGEGEGRIPGRRGGWGGTERRRVPVWAVFVGRP